MKKLRVYSKQTSELLKLLGSQIKLARKKRRWPEAELSERAGISRATIQKIEAGNPNCSIGLVFEAAVLVGINLFDANLDQVSQYRQNTESQLALLPKATHHSRKVKDDF